MKLTSMKTMEETGRWTLEEEKLFIQGCMHHGWGQWDVISATMNKPFYQVMGRAASFALRCPTKKRMIEQAHNRVRRIDAEGRAEAVLRELNYFLRYCKENDARMKLSRNLGSTVRMNTAVTSCPYCGGAHYLLANYHASEISAVQGLMKISNLKGKWSTVAAAKPSNAGAFRPISGASAMVQGTETSKNIIEVPDPIKLRKKMHLSDNMIHSIDFLIESKKKGDVASVLPSNVSAFRPVAGASSKNIEPMVKRNFKKQRKA